MAKVHASIGTCFAFSATVADPKSVTEYDAGTWTAVVKVREAGDQTGTRDVTSNTDLCSGFVDKAAGAIDNGNYNINVAFDPLDAAQVIIDNAFKTNTPLFIRKTFTSGDIDYMEVIVSSRGNAVAVGDEIKRNYTVDVSGGVIEKAA